MMIACWRSCLAVALVFAFCESSLSESNSYVGTYAVDLPSASGCGRRVVLELFSDESFLFVQRYLCRPWSNKQISKGAWKMEDGRVILASTDGEVHFSIGDGGLDYVGSRYGQAGLRLERLK